MSQAILTLDELALSKGKNTAQAGVCQSYFIDLCKGRREAGSNAIIKIAEALDEPTTVVFRAIRESARRNKKARR
jgi:hypothetical protein